MVEPPAPLARWLKMLSLRARPHPRRATSNGELPLQARLTSSNRDRSFLPGPVWREGEVLKRVRHRRRADGGGQFPLLLSSGW